ncbi:DUF4262 domain-containing protein [Williamsia sp.]|uniref:DUF4262 domain-containing protein n=1 Tax=Williamsia sp. TaxID=1872085 RepID=UPI001A249C29|nr:DUF4262 domain-containing protein [Williamsia sp.]MBJ7287819.1 DUF4262 domain-containing protein [Williamsia sp.]
MHDDCDICNGRDHGVGDTLALIAEGRWQVTTVFAGTTHDEPPFAYTTGLTSHGLPELLLYGLGSRTAASVLNTVAHRMVDGEAMLAGTTLDRVLAQGYEVTLVDVDDDSDMYATRGLYDEFTTLQVVFPDRDGRFPWDAGYGLSPCAQPVKGHLPHANS